MQDDLFQGEAEKERHEKAIDDLCLIYPGKSIEIRQCYLQKLESLVTGARIRIYLSILVTREVKALLRNPCNLTSNETRCDNI
ncbi:MAG TPA: hypothetical protein VJ974_08855 [Geopsychrobacteraceae bacterium]|nr:hypothetical protein [Geopsychrobacteraceae bacterium]